jgi:hypothetical protein
VSPLTFGSDYPCSSCKGEGSSKYMADGKCPACLGTGIRSNPDPDRPDFGGETYDPQRDRARLTGSLLLVLEAMRLGGWWSLAGLAIVGKCSQAAASARIRDLRKPRYGGHTIEKRYVADGRWEYRLLEATPPRSTD